LETAGLVRRAGDPADTRAVRLSLTDAGRDVTLRAVGIVHGLQAQLLQPLGGLDSRRTQTFVRDLQALLAAPLDQTSEEES
jgi:DNA-binding MarR family transcriptional regulator